MQYIVFGLVVYNILDGNLIHDFFPFGTYSERKSLSHLNLPSNEQKYYTFMGNEKHELDHYRHALSHGNSDNHH